MREFRPAVTMFILLALICGGLYTAAVTGVAHAFFPRQANGSLVVDRNKREIGSALLGQPFSDARYFWPRPSAATDFAYNPLGSGGSNSGPTNPEFLKTVAERVKAARDAGVAGTVPADLVEASASGLDPDLSPAGALVQAARVAKARGIDPGELQRLVRAHILPRQLGIFGEPRVNVLELNLALDARR